MSTTRTTKFEPYLDRLPTPDKLGEAVALFTSYLFKYFPSADAMELLLYNREEVKSSMEGLLRFFHSQNLFRLRLKRFYHEVFNETVPLEKILYPDTAYSPPFLMYVSRNLSSEKLVSEAKRLLQIEVNGVDESVVFKRIHEQSYRFIYRGSRECDQEFQLLEQGQTIGELVDTKFNPEETGWSRGMNSFEYLLCALFRYWLLGKHYDDNGRWTVFTDIISDRQVLIGQSIGKGQYTFRPISRSIEGGGPTTGMRGVRDYVV